MCFFSTFKNSILAATQVSVTKKRTIISRKSSCSDEPVRTEPSNFDQPSAIGGACKSDLSKGVRPLSPLLTRIASAIGPGRSFATYGMRGIVDTLRSQQEAKFGQISRSQKLERSKAIRKIKKKAVDQAKAARFPPSTTDRTGPVRLSDRDDLSPPFPGQNIIYFISAMCLNLFFFIIRIVHI